MAEPVASVRPFRAGPRPAPAQRRPPLQLAPPPAPLPKRRFYLQVRTRFLISVAASIAWAGLCTWLAIPWIYELAQLVTLPIALAIILGIAIIPGYLNVQLASSLVLDRPRPLEPHEALPGITLIVAAYNEEQVIAETLAYALRCDYAGPFEVVVADDGSTDATRSLVREAAAQDPRVRLVEACLLYTSPSPRDS